MDPQVTAAATATTTNAIDAKAAAGNFSTEHSHSAESGHAEPCESVEKGGVQDALTTARHTRATPRAREPDVYGEVGILHMVIKIS